MIYPNIFFNRYGKWMSLTNVTPVTQARTQQASATENPPPPEGVPSCPAAILLCPFTGCCREAIYSEPLLRLPSRSRAAQRRVPLRLTAAAAFAGADLVVPLLNPTCRPNTPPPPRRIPA